MGVTQQEVSQAEQAAKDARQKADDSQKTADASRETARKSREAADKARESAKTANATADTREGEAAQKRGEADAAARSCQRARDTAADRQQELVRAQAAAQAVHAQYPNECNSDTDTADADVATAQAEVAAANKTRDSACAEAAEKEAAAKQAEDDANDARAAADKADSEADTANDLAERHEEVARTDQATAQQDVVDAANALTAYEQIKREFEAQAARPATLPGPGATPPPEDPDHGDSAGHCGQPKPPTHGQGTTGSSLFDFNLTALTHSWKLSAGKWEKAPIFMEITEGYKHRYTLGTHYTFVGGARAEEVGGLDTKVTLLGDWRQISQKRLERNTGIKVETVWGNVEETTYANEVRNTPVVRQDKNPTNFAGKGPEFEQISTRAINDFKSKAYDKYTTVRIKANNAHYHSNDAYIAANVWNQTITKINQTMDEHTAKFTQLEQQCKEFKIKSSGFVKMIASGSMKLKAGKFSGKVSSKVKAIASSLAEFKGDIKLGG